MKNNRLDDIIKCNIAISNPAASNDETFDSILLVVPGPEKNKNINDVITISQAEKLLDYGFTISDSTYTAATVAFSQSPTPEKIYICIREKAGEEYEDIKATLLKAKSKVDFYGIHITEFRDAKDVIGTIEWAEENEKMFAFEYTNYDLCPVTSALNKYYRSFAMYTGNAAEYESEQPKENDFSSLAWMAKCFGYNPGTETWHLKQLAVIAPSSISTEQKNELAEKNINTFLRYAGNNVTIGGYTLAGEWIDVIRFRDWLKSQMQRNVFNVLMENLKVPFTDEGIGLVEGAMEAALAKGQSIGGIAPDSNENPGFSVTVPKGLVFRGRRNPHKI